MISKKIKNAVTRTTSAALVCLMATFVSAAYAAPKDAAASPPQKEAAQKDAPKTQDVFKTAAEHSKTGFVLKDIHATLKCEQCHVEGIFKNTPKYCSGCHATGTRVAARPKPVNHVPTIAECDTCHISAANFYVRSYKHIGVTGNCIICHNNQSLGVVSKPMTHFPTLLPCETCHTNTSTFLSWKMDHTGITSGCFMCHGGPQPGARTYPGIVSYPPTHITTSPSSDCNACHSNFITFLGATFDHTGVAPGTCGTCHMGQSPGTVSINPAIHIPQSMGPACDTCHTAANTVGYRSFLGAYFHQSAQGNTQPTAYAASCTTCHNGSYAGQGAQAKPPVHIMTTADCGTCHTITNTAQFTTFYGATINHVGTPTAGTVPPFPPYAAFPAVGTTASPACNTCHNGATATGKPAAHVATTADCITCHTPAATGCGNAGACTTWLGAIYMHVPSPYTGTFPPTGGPASPTCNSCHLTGVSGARMKPVGHMATTTDCIVCHSPATTGCGTTGSCTTFFGGVGAVAHTTTSGSFAAACATCHNGSQAVGLSSNPNHIPIGGAACDQCHSAYDGVTSINFGIGASVSQPNIVGASTKYGMKHSVITARCDSCHNGAYVSQGKFGAVAKVTNHIPTAIINTAANNDCTTCHTTLTPATITVVSGTADWFPEIMNHNNAQGGAPNYCVTCHLGSATYLASKIIKKSHNGASLTKDCSTAGCHRPKGTIGAAYSRWN